jgi:hypothetical protein
LSLLKSPRLIEVILIELFRNDGILFAFLEGYLSKLENPLAVQVWSRYIALAKDIATNVKEFRLQAYPALRYV